MTRVGNMAGLVRDPLFRAVSFAVFDVFVGPRQGTIHAIKYDHAPLKRCKFGVLKRRHEL